MRDLNKVASVCIKELESIGIECGNVLEFSVNTRARKRFGQCVRVENGFTINIAAVLLDERNDLNGLKNTLIHELLHTCKGCFNHGETWKSLASKVNAIYGYGIKRCGNAQEHGIKYDTRPKKIVRNTYIIKCSGCGQVITRERKSEFVKYPFLWKCGICGGEFERIQ